jgi:hypothetical protein
MPVVNRRTLVRALLELLVVFIGVTAAFALSEYQKRVEAERRGYLLREALIQEIESTITNTQNVAVMFPQLQARTDSLVAAGERPPLLPMLEPVRVRSYMWEVALQSGGLELLDVRTAYRLSSFYNELNQGFVQLDQLRHLTETILLPNLHLGPEEFYEPSGDLRPKYQWHREGMFRLARLARDITAQGEALVAHLEAENRGVRRASDPENGRWGSGR